MTSVLDAIFGVFEGISEWLIGAIGDITPLFYTAETGLTFIGTLCIIALGIAVILMLINMVRSFLRFR